MDVGDGEPRAALSESLTLIPEMKGNPFRVEGRCER